MSRPGAAVHTLIRSQHYEACVGGSLFLLLLERKVAIDHVHMFLSTQPHDSIAMTVGYLKGNSVIWVHRGSQYSEERYLGVVSGLAAIASVRLAWKSR